MPTPDEARALIKCQLGHRLSTYEAPGVSFVAPSIKGHEGVRGLPSTNLGPCTFYVEGLCQIHDVKPAEGRMAMHGQDWLPVRMYVARTWAGKRFESVCKSLDRAIGGPD